MKLDINGQVREVDADPDMPLLWAIRDVVGLTGTKYGCGMAHAAPARCIWTAQPMRSCQTPISATWQGTKITTIEGRRRQGGGGGADRLAKLDVPQCGYCQSGPDHGGDRAAGREPEADRRGHRRGDERQSLPLRHLPPHPRRACTKPPRLLEA